MQHIVLQSIRGRMRPPSRSPGFGVDDTRVIWASEKKGVTVVVAITTTTYVVGIMSIYNEIPFLAGGATGITAKAWSP